MVPLMILYHWNQFLWGLVQHFAPFFCVPFINNMLQSFFTLCTCFEHSLSQHAVAKPTMRTKGKKLFYERNTERSCYGYVKQNP